MVLDRKPSEECPINAGSSQASILGLPDDINNICNITIYADDTTLYSKWHGVYDLREQRELASEIESDL